MNTKQRMTLLAALMASVGLVAAGCGDNRSAERVGEKIDRTTSQVAAKTEAAADKATAKVGDAAITGSVKTALIAEPNLSALKIDVDTVNGVVTLNGTVDNADQKSRAMSIAQSVSGVVTVKDNLTMKTTG
ncbi:MAG: BON domain-containing protein [Vicinamibacteria bacterium]